MSNKIALEIGEYSVADLHENGRLIVNKLEFIQSALGDLYNKKAMMNRAKNGYISDLKEEIIANKAGLDVSAMFSDD
ncbi:MAG: hypothetical protein CL692_02540 [Cellvibrionales bacterium]|nr:hypothetical protein [Cellvibrionales bacterium]